MFKASKVLLLVLLAATATVSIDAQSRFRIRIPGCTYEIDRIGESSPAAGEMGIGVDVDTNLGNCQWTATSHDSWITITSGGSGTGDGTVTFDVAENGGLARQGTLTIAGNTFTVSQAATASGCTYSLDRSGESSPASGETGITVDVDTSNDCTWTAVSNASWITVTGTSLESEPTPNQPLVGAIRFDLWDRDFIPDNLEFELDRLETDPAIRYRLPYHAVTGVPATVHEGTQAVVDQDINYAADAGLDFWVTGTACSYPNYFVEKTKTSAYRSRMKFAGLLASPLDCRTDALITQINDQQYLKVLGGRPVIFIYLSEYINSTQVGDDPGTPATIAALRSRVGAEAGGMNPVIIGFDFTAAAAASGAAYLGLSGISSYGGGLTCVAGTVAYSVQANCEQSAWTDYKNTGWPYVPTVTTGWDCTPTGCNFFTSEATPAEIATHLTNALTFNATFPASNTSNLLLISAWNEITEGHYLMPYNTNTNATGAGRLDAISAVLNAGGGSGDGDGTATMNVAANLGSARSGTVTIGGQIFTVSQAGASSGGGTIIDEGDINWQWCGQAQCIASVPQITPGGTCTFSWEPNATGGYTQNEGLTYRTISQTSYFMSTAEKRICSATGTVGELFRFHCTFGVAGTCTIDEEYGDIYDGKRLDINNQPTFPNGIQTAGPSAIHWQESTSHVWWAYSADAYGDGTPANRSLGRSTLQSGSGTGIASYSFAGISFARRAGAIVPIPSSFQGSFGNKEYFLCNNGYHSGGASDVSLHCLALNLPASAPDGTQLTGSDFTRVIGHDWPVNCGQMFSQPTWMPPITIPFHCGPNLTDWLDYHNSCIFPDNGSRHGLVCFTNWTLGGGAYISADTAGFGTRTGMTVWDPADLAAVYAGAEAHTPIPIHAWEVQWPGWDYSKFPFVARSRTVTSVVGTGATDIYQFTFSTAHGLAAGDKFGVFGSVHNSINGNTGPDHGFTIMAGGVLNATTVLACRGQDKGDDGNCTTYGENYIPSDFTETNPFTMLTYGAVGGIGRIYGRIAGAVWMPSNSACGGQDNMIAVAYDVAPIIDDLGHLDFNTIHRVIRCGKLN